MRIGEQARRTIGAQEPIDDAGQAGDDDVALLVGLAAFEGDRFRDVREGPAQNTLVDLRGQADTVHRVDLDAVVEELLSVHLEDLHLHHHFPMALVEGLDDAFGRCDLFRGVVDGERIAAGQGGHAPRAQGDAQDVHHLLEISAREVEGLHDLVFVVAPLGRSVGNHLNEFRVDHPDESAAGHRQGLERLLEGRILEFESDRAGGHRRLEHEVHPDHEAERLVGLLHIGAFEFEAHGGVERGLDLEAGEAPFARL